MQHQTDTNNPFLSIPDSKYQDFIDDIVIKFREPGTIKVSHKGSLLIRAVERYYQANIPVDYWDREMANFEGDQSLMKVYDDIIKDIPTAFRIGKSYCFSGSHGKGKTMTAACILKRVAEQGKYRPLYVNLVDIINALTTDNKKDSREYLNKVEFLVIDEFDPRFMGTENAADLFGRVLEPTLRGRIQNRMPTIICTNSINPADSFPGQLKLSFSSLLNKFSIVAAVAGKDFRSRK